MRSERSPEPTCERRSAARAEVLPPALGVVEAGAQHGESLGAVLVLRALLLHDDRDAARDMGEAHGGFGLVDVLPAGAARAHGVDAQIRLVDLDVDLLGLGQHGDGCGGGVDAPRGLGVGHPLDPVHAALEFQPREDAAALDLGHDLLEAAGRALALRDDLDLPALELGIAGVHAQQVAGEERRLVAAGAGPHLEDRALLVGLVARQEQDLQALRGLLHGLLGGRTLLLGERAHLRIGRRIPDQRVESREVLGGGPIGPDRRDDRIELGELARERHEGVGLGPARERRHDDVVAGEDRLEARGGRGGRHLRPGCRGSRRAR